MGDDKSFSASLFDANAAASLRVQREAAKLLAQSWGCAYFEVDTSSSMDHNGVDEAVEGIGHFVKAVETVRPPTSTGVSIRSRVRAPRNYRLRRFFGRMGRMTSFD